jgi:hypothetical protein
MVGPKYTMFRFSCLTVLMDPCCGTIRYVSSSYECICSLLFLGLNTLFVLPDEPIKGEIAYVIAVLI